jgi:predicted phosphoribosyltransferase
MAEGDGADEFFTDFSEVTNEEVQEALPSGDHHYSRSIMA